VAGGGKGWGGARQRWRRTNRVDGRAFHARAAVTGKARSPSVVRRVDGMTSVDVEALRRRRLELTSAVKWRVSARYDSAVPIRQRYARTHNRNWILSSVVPCISANPSTSSFLRVAVTCPVRRSSIRHQRTDKADNYLNYISRGGTCQNRALCDTFLKFGMVIRQVMRSSETTGYKLDR